MKGTVLYGPRDVRFEEIETPKITKPTDAIIRISATCVCGSDLWPYRGLQPVNEPTPMGHEYCGIVEEVGSEVRSVNPGQFVIGSFATSDNTCPHCKAGYQSSCVNREWMLRAQAPVLRVPLADGTLVPTPGIPSDGLIPSFAYDAGGSLTNLTDGKGQITRWKYDQYGRATNKVDATSNEILRYQYDAVNRLTNRWSAAKGTTTYKYDPAGSLTNVVYPVSPSIT